MPLMEVLACNLCRHIFEVDSERQMVGMVGSAPPLVWQWDGQGWASPRGQGFSRADLLVGVVLVVFPTLLVGGSWIFRPIGTGPLAWFPAFWTGLTFVTHLMGILSILVSYYQFSVMTFLKSLVQSVLRNTKLFH